MEKKKILYDTDPGVDDALALLLAVGSGRVSIEGITTVHGNSPVEQTTINALRLLDYLGLDIPVARGANLPWELEKVNAGDFHGSDGLGDSEILPKTSSRTYEADAVDFMIEKGRRGGRTIVATGPLTNIANAFKKDPQTMNSLDELVMMGGAIDVSGNIDRMAEFNFYADPHAADYVLKQDVRKVLVPLDVTRKVILTEELVNSLPAGGKGDLVRSICQKYRKSYMHWTNLPGHPLHDPLAMGYAIDPSFVELTPMNLVVEGDGKYARGVCLPERRDKSDPAENNVYVALGVQSKRFLNYFLDTIVKD